MEKTHLHTERDIEETEGEKEREGKGSRQSPTASSHSTGPVPWANRYNSRRVACLQMCHKMPQLSINCMEIMSVTGLESSGCCRGHAQEGATPTPTGGDGLVLCWSRLSVAEAKKKELKIDTGCVQREKEGWREKEEADATLKLSKQFCDNLTWA